MTNCYGLLFWTIFLVLNELNYVTMAQKSTFDKMMVKPLESKKPSRDKNSAMALFQVNKITNRTASDTTSKVSPAVSHDASEEDEVNEKELSNVGKSYKEKNNENISDKQLLDEIAELLMKRLKKDERKILDKRYLDLVKNNNKAHRHPSIDVDFSNNHLHLKNDESKLYAMRLPVKTIETPDDGILGKLHFRFVPITKNKRVPIRDIYRPIH